MAQMNFFVSDLLQGLILFLYSQFWFLKRGACAFWSLAQLPPPSVEMWWVLIFYGNCPCCCCFYYFATFLAMRLQRCWKRKVGRRQRLEAAWLIRTNWNIWDKTSFVFIALSMQSYAYWPGSKRQWTQWNWVLFVGLLKFLCSVSFVN